MNELPLESCLDALAGGDSLEACLARFPEQRRELEPLLRAAIQLQSFRTVTAPADFRLAARQRLLVQSTIPPQPRSAPWQQLGAALLAALRRPLAAPTLMRVALLVIVVLMGATATSYAAQAALPGSPLYGAKRLGEQVQLRLATDPLAYRLDLAQRRLEEAKALQDRRSIQLVPDVLADYQETLTVWQEMQGESKAKASPDVERQLQDQLTLLSALADRAPAAQLGAFRGSQAAAEKALAGLLPPPVPSLTAPRTPQPPSTSAPGMGVSSTPTATATPQPKATPRDEPTAAGVTPAETPAIATPGSDGHDAPGRTPGPDAGHGTPAPTRSPDGGPGTPPTTRGPEGGHGTPPPTHGPDGGHGTPPPTRSPDGGPGAPPPTRGPDGGHATPPPTRGPDAPANTPGPGSGPGTPDQPPGPGGGAGGSGQLPRPDRGTSTAASAPDTGGGGEQVAVDGM